MFGRRNKNTFHLEECPLTGLYVRDETAKFLVDTSDVAYWVTYKELSCCIVLCGTLYEMLADRSCKDDSDELYHGYCEHDVIEMNDILPVFFGELGKNDFKQLFDRKIIIHWNCNVLNAKNPEEHISIKPFTDIFIKDNRYQYPKTDFDKLRLILDEFKKHKLGKTIEMYGLEYFGKFYMRDDDELQSYINYFEKKGWAKRHCEIHTELTELPQVIEKELFLNHVEFPDTNLISASKTNNLTSDTDNQEIGNDLTFDIGLSFAGEQRKYVEQVANFLSEKQIKVFYDKYEEVSLWGKDLYQHLNDVYKNKCKYCIIFISNDYAKKLWTKHELASAQTRAFKENREYILPVRFDNTEIPGLNETVGYIDANTRSPKEIAELAFKKLNSGFPNIY